MIERLTPNARVVGLVSRARPREDGQYLTPRSSCRARPGIHPTTRDPLLAQWTGRIQEKPALRPQEIVARKVPPFRESNVTPRFSARYAVQTAPPGPQ